MEKLYTVCTTNTMYVPKLLIKVLIVLLNKLLSKNYKSSTCMQGCSYLYARYAVGFTHLCAFVNVALSH